MCRQTGKQAGHRHGDLHDELCGTVHRHHHGHHEQICRVTPAIWKHVKTTKTAKSRTIMHVCAPSTVHMGRSAVLTFRGDCMRDVDPGKLKLLCVSLRSALLSVRFVVTLCYLEWQFAAQYNETIGSCAKRGNIIILLWQDGFIAWRLPTFDTEMPYTYIQYTFMVIVHSCISRETISYFWRICPNMRLNSVWKLHRRFCAGGCSKFHFQRPFTDMYLFHYTW